MVQTEREVRTVAEVVVQFMIVGRVRVDIVGDLSCKYGGNVHYS